MDPLDRQVLILDDDAAFAESARSVLRQAATRVKAVNGVAALATARATRWDLIVCALELKPLSGLELKRQLGADPLLAGVPFLFVGRVIEGPGLPSGADAPLKKPVDPDQLLARVRRALGPAAKPPPLPTERMRTGTVPAVRRQASGQVPTLGRRTSSQVPAVGRRTSSQVPAVGRRTSSQVPAVGRSGGPGSSSNVPRIEAPAELAGGLDTFAISDVLQMLEAGRATGVLSIAGKALTGELIVRDGKVVVARTNHRSGEDAALRLVWLDEGRFGFEKQAVVDAPDGPGWPIGRLLMDAAWLHDELRRLGDRAPGVTDRVEIADAAAAANLFPDNAAWKALVASRRPPLIVEELAMELGISTYRCRALLGKAAESGAVHIIPGPPAM